MTAPYRQHVPRPDDARPGRLPRWTELEAVDRAHVSIERVRGAFATVRAPVIGDGSVEAAVLVPIAALGDEASVLLIRRSDLVLDPGHIAFPGGHVEAGESPLNAALRETEEEIGLDRAEIEVIGAFPPIGRRRGDARVAPFVGLVHGRPVLVPDRDEVAEVFEVPIAALAEDRASWQEVWAIGSDDVEMTFFGGIAELGSELVWGLSARILSALLVRVLLGGEKATV
ncbi:MAG: CoA pyrophosphatase [Acidimicrobiales bacterium]